MIEKSRPDCLAGERINLSTFSSNTYFGFFSLRISSICHQSAPLVPLIPAEFFFMIE